MGDLETLKTLTRRQKQLLDFLEKEIARNGYAPTLEEIGAEFGLTSLATVHKHLSNLEEKGLIKRHAGRSRAVELLPQQTRVAGIELPLLGLAAAGEPIEAMLHDEVVTVPEEMVRKEESFVLRISGESMRDDGILDGDLVVVESRQTAENGATVVAVLNGEATVKRFFREKGGRVRLQPANDRFPPILCHQGDLEIRGVIVGLMRRYD